MKLCDKITKLRKRKGYSQEALASIMEVSRQSVFKWESGENTPDLEKIRKLTKVFDVSFDELLDDDVELREVSEVSPRQETSKNTPLKIVLASLGAVALVGSSFAIGYSIKKRPVVVIENSSSSYLNSAEESSETNSYTPTGEELTASLTVDDLVGKWETARYIWTIGNFNGNVMLYSVYDKVDKTQDAPELKPEYYRNSVFDGYNETTGLMEGKIFHYTGTDTVDWYIVNLKKSSDGDISIYYKNLTFKAY
ncbi:MAG: helix-turn-helix domain-containing protein [Bacilli bacterium]|nr:helix-turn-helix domain-containing protein [Bacilli bacterium]